MRAAAAGRPLPPPDLPPSYAAMQCVPLGDQAILVYLADEPAAVRLAAAVRAAAPPWLHDVVPAYASVGVFFDADRIGVGEVMEWLGGMNPDPSPRPPPPGGEGEEAPSRANPSDGVFQLERPPSFSPSPPGGGGRGEGSENSFLIPVCYEFGPDLAHVAAHLGLPAGEVIRLHTAAEYTVYAIGFVPGFPYLGYLPPGLCGVPRLTSPRLRVEPGSVGVTGRQTAVYPLARPGGWPLIGRTPLVLVDVADGFFPLRVGDRVRFARIDERRYRELEGERLIS